MVTNTPLHNTPQITGPFLILPSFFFFLNTIYDTNIRKWDVCLGLKGVGVKIKTVFVVLFVKMHRNLFVCVHQHLFQHV